MIKGIRKLRPEQNLYSLRRAESLAPREIPVIYSGPAHDANTGIAFHVGGAANAAVLKY